MRARSALTALDATSVMRYVAALAALALVAVTTADPDIWGHVRFGEDIIDARSITSTDPYSFTSDREWVNHEWLAEVVMAAAYRAAGATGLVVLKTVLVVAALALVSLTLRRVTWRPIDHDALLGLTILGTLPRTHHMRPQVFSVLLFAALLFVLTAADRGNRRALCVVPIVMLVWTNLHGGWIVGLGVLTIWVVLRMLRPRPGLERRRLSLLWVSSVAATLVNPYGIGIWTFLRDTVGLSRPGIFDWLPLLELPLLLILAAAAVVATAAVALAKARGSADPAYVAIVVALVVGTLRIGRIDAFLALAVVMLLGPYLGRTRAARPAPARRRAPALWRPALAFALMLVITAGWAAGARSELTCVFVQGEPEPEAVEFLARYAPRANALTYFGWGEYAIWQLGPEFRVSMDGRRETVYSEALFGAHMRLYGDEPGATALAARLRPDLIWLPAAKPVVARLRREGWKAVFRGPTSVILARRVIGPTVHIRRASRTRRCFPNR